MGEEGVKPRRTKSCPDLPVVSKSIPARKTSAPQLVIRTTPVRELELPTPLVLTHEGPVPRYVFWHPFSQDDMLLLREFKEEEAMEYIGLKIGSDGRTTSSRLLNLLLYEVLQWGISQKLSDLKISLTIWVFLQTHRFFVSYLWTNQNSTYSFFVDAILVYCISDPPMTTKVFEAWEVKGATKLFCRMYLSVLPLLRLNGCPMYRLFVKYQPFLTKESASPPQIGNTKSDG